MTKNEAIEKANQIIDNDKRKTILEKRITRLENLVKNESTDDPSDILLGAMNDGYISAEALCRELIAQMSVDELWSVCDDLDLVEESNKASDKHMKNEDTDDEDDEDWDEEDEDCDEDDDSFESRKRPAIKSVKNESDKKPAKHSLVSRFRK
jgi:hypothetical protein